MTIGYSFLQGNNTEYSYYCNSVPYLILVCRNVFGLAGSPWYKKDSPLPQICYKEKIFPTTILWGSALFIKGNNTLYGRYWGTIEQIDGLHFECCYYQAIKYCIENNIHCFQPGTQGDYKRRRGFKPEFVYGTYYFHDSGLQYSIQRYLKEEAEHLEKLFVRWQESEPYK